MKINVISNSLLRSLHCNNIVITKFSFSYHYYVHYAVIKTKAFSLLIIKLISPLRLLRQDLEKLKIFILLLLLLRSLQRDSDKKNIILTFTFLLHPRLLLPSPCHDQENSFFISLLLLLRHDQKKKNNNLVATTMT